MRFAKPLDENSLLDLAKAYKQWFVFSDSSKIGGIGDILNSFLQKHHLQISLTSFEYEDFFIPHGKVEEIESKLGLDEKSILTKILNRKN